MSGIVSHDTDQMRNWSNTMDTNASDYDDLISKLYILIDQFVGSEFKGGLSTDFVSKVIEQRPTFMKYSETFKECSELINSRAQKIDSDEEQLRSMINKANPLG